MAPSRDTPVSLRDALYGRFLATAAVPIVLVCLVACAYLWHQELRDARWKNEMLAGSVARQVEVFLHEPTNMLSHGRSTVERYGGMRGGKTLDIMLSLLVRDSDLFEGLYLIDRSGRVVSLGLRGGSPESVEELRGIDLSGHRFLMDVVRSGRSGWSDSWWSPSGGKPSLALCVPVFDGALVGNIEIAHFERIAKGAAASGIGVAILDRGGVVLAHSDPSLVGRSVSLRDIPLVTAGLGGGDSTGEFLQDGIRHLGSVARVGNPRWIVLVSQPVSDAVSAVWKLFAIFIGGGLLAIATASRLSRRQARAIAGPFAEIAYRAERIAEGSYEVEAGDSRYLEARRLADRFGEMAAAVRDREARLEDSVRLFRTLFDGVRDGILLCGLRDDGGFGNYLEANEYACRLLGYSRDELLARTVFDLTPPETHGELAERGRSLVRGEAYLRETTFLAKGGRGIPVEVNARMILLEGRKAALAVIRDVSERKRSEREKEELEAKLRQSQKLEAIGTLAGGVAHDFNNLLQVIAGYTALALKETPPEGSLRDALVQVADSAERAAELVGRLLAFSRKESLRKRVFRLAPEIERAVRLLEFTFPKMISIRTRIAPDLAAVEGDPSQTVQVVVNLCTNARDAMPEGGTITIEAGNEEVGAADPSRAPACPPGRYVAIRVSDTGTGMDESTRARIFDPFFTTKEVGKGTGLGLSIVYGIVQSHGGWVSCESEPGSGTTFTVWLPAAAEEDGAAEDGAPTAGASSPAPRPGGRGGHRVLLADDDRAVRNLAVSILQAEGYEVDAAGSGEEALEIFRSGGCSHDLVVLDLGMPGMGGARCLEAIRRESPSVRAIVASGYVPEEQAAEIRALGATIVSKPYGLGEFEGAVRRVLEGA